MRRQGQSFVEFALLLPILLLLLYGLGEFGFLLYAHVQVANATREGARAGSLYLGNRFHYTAANGGDDCWSMQEWVENALVQRNRDGKGCPQASFSETVHAFGLLDFAQCAGADEINCWTLEPLKINNEVITDTPEWIGDRAGQPLLVEVRYRYELPLLGYVFKDNPLIIQKRVIMRVQNN